MGGVRKHLTSCKTSEGWGKSRKNALKFGGIRAKHTKQGGGRRWGKQKKAEDHC